MWYALGADTVVAVHAAFVVFVIAGGLLLLRWPRLVWVHAPAVVWGVMVELAGWPCPLTEIEIGWRIAAGESGYQGSFIERYLFPLLYPAGLQRSTQVVLGVLVIAINGTLYGWIAVRRRRAASQPRDSAKC